MEYKFTYTGMLVGSGLVLQVRESARGAQDIQYRFSSLVQSGSCASYHGPAGDKSLIYMGL